MRACVSFLLVSAVARRRARPSPPSCRSSMRTCITAMTRGRTCRRRMRSPSCAGPASSRALVSSSGDEGTQRLVAEAPDLVLPSLRPYRTRGDIATWVRDESVVAFLEDRLARQPLRRRRRVSSVWRRRRSAGAAAHGRARPAAPSRAACPLGSRRDRAPVQAGSRCPHPLGALGLRPARMPSARCSPGIATSGATSRFAASTAAAARSRPSGARCSRTSRIDSWSGPTPTRRSAGTTSSSMRHGRAHGLPIFRLRLPNTSPGAMPMRCSQNRRPPAVNDRPSRRGLRHPFACRFASPLRGACGTALSGATRTIEGANYTVVFKTVPDPISTGAHFALDFAVCPRAAAPVPRAVRVDANMPEHRHGMNYRPVVTAQAAMTYPRRRTVVPHAGPLGRDVRHRYGQPSRAADRHVAARVMRAVLALVATVAILAAFGAAAAPDSVAFSESEIRRILAHGPWPPPMQKDPSNRASGNTAAIAWGAAALSRSPAIGQWSACLRELPSSGEELHGRPAEGAWAGRGRSQHAECREHASAALVRLGWRRRQPVGAEPAANGRSARNGQRRRASGRRRAGQRGSRERLSQGVRRSAAGRRRGARRGCRQGARGLPGDDRNGTHAVRRLPRCALARRPSGRGALSARGAAGAQDLHRQGTVQRLPYRSPLFQRRVPRCRHPALRRAGTRGRRAVRRHPEAPGEPLQSGGPLQRRPDAKHGDEHSPRRCRRIGTSASSRFRRCATWHAPRRTCTTAALPRWRT